MKRIIVLVAVAIASVATAAEEPGLSDTSWPSYNRTPDGQRFSALDQIDVENAASLAEVCRVKVDETGSFHTSLILVNGTIYLTTAHDTLAIDPTNCDVRWRHVYKPEQDEVFPVNRGVAYANGKLFRGTSDGRLLAIDAETGKTIWQHQAADPGQGEFFSAAPAAWQGLFIIGTAGSDWGIRGRVMAYDQETGREVWRFNTFTRGADRGAERWQD